MPNKAKMRCLRPFCYQANSKKNCWSSFGRLRRTCQIGFNQPFIETLNSIQVLLSRDGHVAVLWRVLSSCSTKYLFNLPSKVCLLWEMTFKRFDLCKTAEDVSAADEENNRNNTCIDIITSCSEMNNFDKYHVLGEFVFADKRDWSMIRWRILHLRSRVSFSHLICLFRWRRIEHPQQLAWSY